MKIKRVTFMKWKHMLCKQRFNNLVIELQNAFLSLERTLVLKPDSDHFKTQASLLGKLHFFVCVWS